MVLQGVDMKGSWFGFKDASILDVPCVMTWSNRKRQGIILIRKAKTRVLRARGLEVALMLKANARIAERLRDALNEAGFALRLR